MAKPSFFSDAKNRQWAWRVLLALLIFLLLGWGVWRYFTMQLKKISVNSPAPTAIFIQHIPQKINICLQ